MIACNACHQQIFTGTPYVTQAAVGIEPLSWHLHCYGNAESYAAVGPAPEYDDGTNQGENNG